MLVEIGIFETIYVKSVDCLGAIRSGNHLHARREVDSLRQLRASFARFLSAPGDQKTNEARMVPLVASLGVVAKTINANLDAIERMYAELLDDLPPVHEETEGWHRVMDRLLPLQWSWEEDILLLSDEPDTAFRQVLQDRGQRRVIFLSSGPLLRDEVGVVGGTYFVPFGDKPCLDKAFSEWSLAPPALVTQFALGSGSQVNLAESSRILQDMATAAGAGRNTSLLFSRLWIKQQYENSEAVCRGHTHAELLELLSRRDVIVISPGPSLRKNIALLSKAKGSAILLAVAQACPALTKHGIAPDLVLFSDPGDHVALVDDFTVENAFGLIINAVCHPGFFRRGFRRVFPIISSVTVNGLEQSFSQERMELFGGSVSINAVSLCIKAHARSVALIGQDLSFGDALYYDRPGSSMITKMDSEAGFVDIGGCRHRIFSLKGYYGGEVFTKPDYWLYHRQFEDIGLNGADSVRLFNCTEGGANIEGFQNITLLAYIDGLQPQQGLLNVPDVSKLEYERRAVKLSFLYEGQCFDLRNIVDKCEEILNLLNSNSAHELIDDIGALEVSLMSVISPILPLHFMMQHSLLKFKVLSGQVNTIDENIECSKELYKGIIDDCVELEKIVSGAAEELCSL